MGPDCEYHVETEVPRIAICALGRFGGTVNDVICNLCPYNRNGKALVHTAEVPVRKSDAWLKTRQKYLLGDKVEAFTRAMNIPPCEPRCAKWKKYLNGENS
jgi:hypothetical protein